MAYKKCPRCEMNWIQDTEELCEVCKAELGIKSTITLLDDDYAEKALGAKLCPICGINYIDENEDMWQPSLLLSWQPRVSLLIRSR